MGQESAGAIDFTLTFAESYAVNGNVNYYAIDPFEADYTTEYYDSPSTTVPATRQLGAGIPTIDD